MNKVLMFIADGFEECEALLVVDILRRGNVEVTTASITNNIFVEGSHKITIKCDALASDLKLSQFEMLVLPGGIPGTINLDNSPIVKNALIEFKNQNKKIAAICAAPFILDKNGILNGKKAVAHKNFRKELLNADLTIEEVVVDGNIITAWGLGAAIPFGLELLNQLTNEENVAHVRDGIDYIH